MDVVEFYSKKRQIDCLKTKCILKEENAETLCDTLLSAVPSKCKFFDKNERALFRATAHYIMEVSKEPKTLNDVIVFLENSTPEDITLSFASLRERNPDSKAVKLFEVFLNSSIFNYMLDTIIGLSSRLRRLNSLNCIQSVA